MEDKIGVALGMNRIGVNYFNLNRFEKALEFHLKNVELSDRENSFAAFYNLGINYRSLGKYEEALDYFRRSLEWARDFRVSTNSYNIKCLIFNNTKLLGC